ncbi:MAG: GYD domain-containing protein [Roseiarcus sp.]
MAHFMVRWQFTGGSAKAMVETPQDRTATARMLVESFGGKLHHYYFAFGEYDGVGICEFQDNAAVAAFSMAAASTGAFSRFETTALLTGKEAEAAMKRAHDTKTTGYKPPNA